MSLSGSFKSLVLRLSVSRVIVLIYSSTELPELTRVISKNSLKIKNSELKPLGLYSFLRLFYISYRVVRLRIYRRGLSSIASLIRARALLVSLGALVGSIRGFRKAEYFSLISKDCI